MNVLLLFPPHWVPTMPHLALPTLTACLRAHGVEVAQRDLNVEFFDQVLTPDYVAQSVARLCREHDRRPGQTARGVSSEAAALKAAAWAWDRGPELARSVQAAKGVLRGEAFFDGPAGLSAFEAIVQCLQVALLPFYPASFEFTRFVPPAPVDRSASLLQLVCDGQRNPFLDLFRRGVLADVEQGRPDLVGISVCTMDQMLAGMTLGHLIREAGLPCHVTVGGPHITMLREQLPRSSSIWRCFDSAVVFSGQKPLLRLVQALADGGDLSGVPNLIYRRNGQAYVNPVESPDPIGDRPLPDFDGLPLERYLSPRLILPLLAAHGCYYGHGGRQCAFCNQGYGGVEPYSHLDGGQVVEQMMALHAKYGTRHIFFADEALPPRTLRDMSKKLRSLGAPVEWIGCARFEKALSADLLEDMALGGCRMLLFGLESGSPKTLDRIGKGTRPDEVSRILQQSAQVGIWNHLFFFFGFPGETMDDAQETVNLIYKHQHDVHSASPGTFLLERYAPAHVQWKKHGIRQVSDLPEKDLSIYFDYQVQSGIDEAMAERAVDGLIGVLPGKRFGHYYMHDSYRFLYASYLKQQGKPFPLWLMEEML